MVDKHEDAVGFWKKLTVQSTMKTRQFLAKFVPAWNRFRLHLIHLVVGRFRLSSVISKQCILKRMLPFKKMLARLSPPFSLLPMIFWLKLHLQNKHELVRIIVTVALWTRIFPWIFARREWKSAVRYSRQRHIKNGHKRQFKVEKKYFSKNQFGMCYSIKETSKRLPLLRQGARTFRNKLFILGGRRFYEIRQRWSVASILRFFQKKKWIIWIELPENQEKRK